MENTLEGFTWSTVDFVGEGGFGKVYKGYGKDPNEQDGARIEVAVKVMDLHRYDKYVDAKRKVKTNISREIEILKLLSHCPNIVHLIQDVVTQDGDLIYLFMELCQTDLHKILKANGTFDSVEAKNFLVQMAEGLRALRQEKVVHRDLKPGNILVNTEQDSGKRIYKIADFGYARTYMVDVMIPDCETELQLKTTAGTPVYMAPEALVNYFTKGKTFYDSRVDIWSVGAVLYRCLVGQNAFQVPGGKSITQAHWDFLDILKKKGDAIAFEPPTQPGKPYKYIYELKNHDDFPREFVEYITSLLKRLLNFDPEERISFQDFFATAMASVKKVGLLDVWSGDIHEITDQHYSNVATLLPAVDHLVRYPRPCDLVLINEEKEWIISPAEPTCPGGQEFLHGLPLQLVVIPTNWSCLHQSLLTKLTNCLDKASGSLEKGVNKEAENHLFGSKNGLYTISERLLSALALFRNSVTGRYSDQLPVMLSVQSGAADCYGKASGTVKSLRVFHELLSSEEFYVEDTVVDASILAEFEAQVESLKNELDAFNATLKSLGVWFSTPVFCQDSGLVVQLRTLCKETVQSFVKADHEDLLPMLKKLVQELCAHLYTGFDEVFCFWETLVKMEKSVIALEKHTEDLNKNSSTLYKQTFNLVYNVKEDGFTDSESIGKPHPCKRRPSALWQPLTDNSKQLYDGEDILKCGVTRLSEMMLPSGMFDRSVDVKVVQEALTDMKKVLGLYASVPINFSGNYKPGDVVAFSSCQQYNTFVALQFDQQRKVYLDEACLDQYRREFKMIPGSPIMLATVQSCSERTKPTSSRAGELSLVCAPWPWNDQ